MQLKCVPELKGQMVSNDYIAVKINTEQCKKSRAPKYFSLKARNFQSSVTSKDSGRRYTPDRQGRGQCCPGLVHGPQKAKSLYLFRNQESLGALLSGRNSDDWISQVSSSLLPSLRKIWLLLTASSPSVYVCNGIPAWPYLTLMITRLIYDRRNFKSLTILWDLHQKWKEQLRWRKEERGLTEQGQDRSKPKQRLMMWKWLGEAVSNRRNIFRKTCRVIMRFYHDYKPKFGNLLGSLPKPLK